MALPLTASSLAEYLNQLYPDRVPGHLDELEDLIADDLRPAGYTTMDEVAGMLVRTSEAVLRREREDPPMGTPGQTFHRVGLVRLALGLDRERATLQAERMAPDNRRAPPGMFHTPEEVVARLRDGAESAGARCAGIDWYDSASGMAAGFALLPPAEEDAPGYAVVTVSKMLLPEIVERGFWIYVTGGVVHEPRGTRAAILESCNNWNGEFPDFPAFAHPSSGDILIQERLWSGIAFRTPELLDLWSRVVPHYLERLRSSLTAAGVEGSPYQWSYACALAALSVSGTQRWTWATEPAQATSKAPPLAASVEVGTSSSTRSTTSTTSAGNRACVTGSCEACARRTSERICPSCGQATQLRPNQ